MSSHIAAEVEEEERLCGMRTPGTQLKWGAFRAMGGSRSVVWVKNTVQGCVASNRIIDESDPIELFLNQIL